MVKTRTGLETSPYSKEQQEKMAALVKENRERKEREKQAKLKVIADEQATKMKEIEEEMEKKKKAAEEEAAAEEERERKKIESEAGSSGTKVDRDAEIEKKISEWVANLSLGGHEEMQSYVTEDEKAALAAELAAMADPMERREGRRAEVAMEVEDEEGEEEEERRIRDFARDIVTHIGGEFKQIKDNVGKYCEGAIEGAKAIAVVEGGPRPHKEPVKLKFPDAYGGKKEENFDNWEANVNSYIYLQHILTEEQVLLAFQALKDEATSFARSLARAVGYDNNMVAYSTVTSLPHFLKLQRERFADPTRGIRASDKQQMIHSRQWRSAKALKGVMDDLVAVPDHGVTETQLVQLFYRAMPESLRGHCFNKTEQAGITYDALSREMVLFESKSMPVTTFWHKDLEKGKKWKDRTISGQVKAKDHLILTLEEGGTDEVPYDQIEWGLGEEDSSVGRGRSYAAVAAGEKPQGRGGGQRGQANGGRGSAAQGVGGQGNRQAGGRGQGPPSNRQGSFRVPTARRWKGTSRWMAPRLATGQALGGFGLGRHFKVYLDHETLRWLKTQAKMTPKLTRWAAEIDQFDFELKPVKGKYNVVADALSRRSDYFGVVVHYLDKGRDLQEKVKQAYAQDPIYSDLLKRVREAPETEPDYRTTDGLLFEKTNVFDRLCVPNSEEIRSLILGECHDTEGHFGWQKTSQSDACVYLARTEERLHRVCPQL
ncbi:hypothetical protein CBR_g28896 [Chara braunii]|uniref:Reverse transcriptase RNase H-like domain-containing protein n=1 Tax=Chara braunii TaxID=69332 RepID=A0A388LA48_CHABU|nr:hypothetical protein CBR_g28896 [Chara braunii]|eukprot:GBG79180.1 hypothetical protein CBR_g28896 [Chara braunii]